MTLPMNPSLNSAVLIYCLMSFVSHLPAQVGRPISRTGDCCLWHWICLEVEMERCSHESLYGMSLQKMYLFCYNIQTSIHVCSYCKLSLSQRTMLRMEKKFVSTKKYLASIFSTFLNRKDCSLLQSITKHALKTYPV